MVVTNTLMRALDGRTTRRTRILSQANRRLERMIQSLDFYDGNAVQTFAQEAAELSIRTQGQMVSLTTATQLRYMTEVGVDLQFAPEVPDDVRGFGVYESGFVKPKKVKVLGKQQERLPTEEIFNRPAREYRAKVAKGMDESKALEHSAKRAKLFLGTNVSLAEREATHQILDEGIRTSKGRVTGWRRVIHPEASASGVCGLCLAASDRVYTREDIKPLHDNCECETLPVTRDADPGKDLNEEDLKKLYDLAGGTAAKQLGRLAFQYDVHGELGAILVPERRGKKVEPVKHFVNPEYWETVPVDLDEAATRKSVAERELPGLEDALQRFDSSLPGGEAAREVMARMAENYRNALAA